MRGPELADPEVAAAASHGRGRSPGGPSAFARWCARLGVAVAIVGVAGLVHLLWALPLAGLLLVLGAFARLAAADVARADAAFSSDEADPSAGEPEQLEEPQQPEEPSLPEGPDLVPALRLPLPVNVPVPPPSPAPGPRTVVRTFSLPTSVGAQRVQLVGEFNGWSSTAHLLRREGDRFTIDLELEADRTFRYRYLLDGVRWENDWAADGYAPNQHGSEDSIVRT